MVTLKKFLSSKTRKLVASPDPTPQGGNPAYVRVLGVTRNGWTFDCPVKGKRSLLFENMTEEQAERILKDSLAKENKQL